LFPLSGCGGGGSKAPVVQPEVILATFPFTQSAQAASGNALTGIVLFLSDGASAPSFDISPVFSGAEAGTSYEYIPDGSAGYVAWLARITDGVNNESGSGSRRASGPTIGGASTFETSLLQNLNAGLSGPDLQGGTITRITLDIATMVVNTGLPWDYGFSATITVHGRL